MVPRVSHQLFNQCDRSPISYQSYLKPLDQNTETGMCINDLIAELSIHADAGILGVVGAVFGNSGIP